MRLKRVNLPSDRRLGLSNRGVEKIKNGIVFIKLVCYNKLNIYISYIIYNI